jgi:hypothetical protein
VKQATGTLCDWSAENLEVNDCKPPAKRGRVASRLTMDVEILASMGVEILASIIDSTTKEHDEKQLAEILEVDHRKPPAKQRRVASRLTTGVEVSARIDSTSKGYDKKQLAEILEVDNCKPPAKRRRVPSRLTMGVEVLPSIDSTTMEHDEKQLAEILEVDNFKPPAKRCQVA